MSNKGALDDLKTFISIQTDEELVWALHVFNEWYEQLGSYDYRTREQNNSGLNSDIDCLNSFKHLKDIKSYILKICESYHRDEIDDLLGRLIDFKSKINVSSIDFTTYKENRRFLNFACKLMNETVRERELNNFKSPYINFLYVALTYPRYYENPRRVEAIISNFSEIHSKFPSHFKDDKNEYFYIWAKKYMDENPAYRSKSYNPTVESEYRIVVDSIFDMLYYENEEVHYALRKKISNAWYQKKYRQANKGKKEHYYALTKKAKECLKTLCYTRNLNESQVIESLINECYAKECRDKNGNPLYE
ncbi:MAG: hypothetical protein PBU42_11905 [Acinetobacter haemolyticus]